MAQNSMEILLIIPEKAMENIIRQMDKYLKVGLGLLAGAALIVVARKLYKTIEHNLDEEKKAQDQNSPSKKSYRIYWNYILGARNALSNGGKVLVDAIKKINKKE